MEIEDQKTPIWQFWTAAGLVAAIWLGNLYFLYAVEDRGTYGDMFGAANAIFSGLAFSGVVYAIFLQRHEVKIAKEEIRNTKKLLTKQQELAELQQKSEAKRTFENTFFNVLSLFSENVSAIDLQGGPVGTISGKDVFPVFYDRVKKNIVNRKLDPMPAYDKFYLANSSDLGHYFRTLYNIIKLIDQSEVENKKFYTNLVRAQLSDFEANLLLLNGLSDRGKEKFKPLIERYALLKNANPDNTEIAKLKDCYDPSAF